tara:strand:- start:14 stop:214 length:201 start_codon:yes stop_codon:yes gene_type:complete
VVLAQQVQLMQLQLLEQEVVVLVDLVDLELEELVVVQLVDLQTVLDLAQVLTLAVAVEVVEVVLVV